MRFNKRIKIAPGVKLNLSKKGVSTTVGGRGASVNVGRKGSYLNTSLPGTGLSNRTKLGKTTKGRQSKASPKSGSGSSFFTVVKIVLILGVLAAFVF